MSVTGECHHWELPSEERTAEFARHIARLIVPGTTIFLQGPLGAGKTTIVRHMLRARGNQDAVLSPTFALVNSYPEDELAIHHFDLYRVNDPEELELIGFREYFDQDSCCLIEWPDRAGYLLPTADITIEVSPKVVNQSSADLASANQRLVTISIRKVRRDLADTLHSIAVHLDKA